MGRDIVMKRIKLSTTEEVKGAGILVGKFEKGGYYRLVSNLEDAARAGKMIKPLVVVDRVTSSEYFGMSWESKWRKDPPNLPIALDFPDFPYKSYDQSEWWDIYFHRLVADPEDLPNIYLVDGCRYEVTVVAFPQSAP
jgi:hypothetical protein